MCYYEQTHYQCKDWKWGNMKQRCDQQHRIGETCGRKLVHDEFLVVSQSNCRICNDLDVKRRKRDKELDNIARWRKEGGKFSASIEKAENEIDHLNETIRDLNARRPSVIAGLNQGRHAPAPPPQKPPFSHPVTGDPGPQHLQQMKDRLNQHASISGTNRHSNNQTVPKIADSRHANIDSRYATSAYRRPDQSRQDRHRGG